MRDLLPRGFRSALCFGALALLPGGTAPLAGGEIEDVVITEIMYNPASGDRREDFIEIHNRSATETYNLAGWSFTSGVGFTFPAIDLGPGAYLVICADEVRIRQIYGITNTAGNWDPLTTLDNGGERIKLVSDEVDAGGSPVEIEDLTYDDRPPWPILADGYGNSLERRRLDYDNDDPANWAASSASSSWSRFTVTGLATSSRLYLYLTGAGVAYVDDVRLFPVGNPGDDRIQNGGFESGIDPWVRTGTHSGSLVTSEEARSGARSLKIVASGAGNSQPNSVYQEGLGLADGDPYTLEFFVRFTEPGQSLVARLSGAGGEAEPIYLEVGGGGATPGRENSVNTSDLPPFIYPVDRSPAAPTAGDPVTILAVLRDDFAVAEVTLHWDSGGGEETAAMADDGLHQDGAAGDGIFARGIGSFPTGTIVRYWVTARDGAGQEGRFPFPGSPTATLGFYIEPAGIDPAFQARNNNGYPANNSTLPPVYHFLIDPAELTGNPPHLSGDLRLYRRATFVYNGEVFDNVRIRHRGQTSLGRPKKHWKVNFNKDHRFLTPFPDHPEVDNVNVQSSEGDKSFLREWLAYKAFMDVGTPALEMWHVRLYVNGVYRGLYIHLENPKQDFLQRAGLDDEGWLWKSYSQAQSGSTGGFEMEADAGDPARANSALGSFLAQINSLQGASLTSYIEENMNVEAFTDFLALHQLMHNADHPAKNYLVYADEDSPAGTWTYLLWDADLTHGRNFECSDCGLGGGVWNDCMRADMWNDPQLMFGTRIRPKCDGPWNGVIDAFLRRSDAFRDAYYARTAQFLEDLYHPDVLGGVIDDLSSPLVPEVVLDWQINPPTYGRRNAATPSDYLLHVNEIKRWAQSRYDALTASLAELSAPGIAALECVRAGAEAELSWTNRSLYDEIRVYRTGVLVGTLDGRATSARVPLDLETAINTFRVASVVDGTERPGETCTILITTGGFTTVIDESFSPPAPESELAVNCAAVQTNGRLELTPPEGGQAGSAFFRMPLPIDDFIADFDLRFDEPSDPGADGIVFILNTGGDPAVCGAAGGALGYFDGDGGSPVMPGYAVVFDTWQNPGEVSHNWCGFIDASRGGAAQEAADVPEEFNGSGTFHATVHGQGGTFTLLLSNDSLGMGEREIFTATVPGFPAGQEAYFGFSAGTGGAVARHIVDNVVIQVASEGPEPPVADFTASPRSGTAPLRVTFADLSSGEITSYFWEFGDGGTSTASNPAHTYQTGGTYSPKLTVTGPGGRDERIRPGYITASNPIQVVAEFSAAPTVGQAPLEVRFTNLSTNATSYFWDFGDGQSSIDEHPVHVYASPGEFTVELRALAAGGEDTQRRVNYIQVDDILEADFTASPRSGPAPLEVQFAEASRGSTIQAWSWDFGDGGSSVERHPQHTYTRDGTYTVTLQIFGFAGLSAATRNGYIRVGGPASGTFIRGRVNTDERMDLSDGVAILNVLFRGQGAFDCPDAADTDDNGRLELTDAVRIFRYLFAGGPAPAPPFPDPGEDATPDSLGECRR